MTETIIWPEDGMRARIAKLEADLADLHSSFMADASIHKAEVAELEAKLEALKARRCGDCVYAAETDGCPVYDAAWVTFGAVPFNCCCWIAWDEEGSRDE